MILRRAALITAIVCGVLYAATQAGPPSDCLFNDFGDYAGCPHR